MTEYQDKVLKAALGYYDEGLCVIPVPHGLKSAYEVDWKKYQQERPSREQVAEWFSDGKDHNIGVVCGKPSGGLVGVCFNDMSTYEQAFRGENPETFTKVHRTYRGTHVLVKTDQYVKIHRSRNSEIELQGDTGIVVMPPSLHPEGIIYKDITPEVEDIAFIPDFWDWIECRAFRAGFIIVNKRFIRQQDWVSETLTSHIKEHEGRDNACIRLAGFLRNHWQQEKVARYLVEWDKSYCEPPLGEDMVLRKVESAFSYAAQEQYEPVGEVTGDVIEFKTLRDSLNQPVEEITPLIAGWVMKGNLTLLIGSGGVGKSTVRDNLAMSAASGEPFLNYAVPEAVKVFCLDLEMSQYELRMRYNLLAKHYPETAQDNLWLANLSSFTMDSRRNQQRLENTLALIRPQLFIVDNHASFHGGDPNRENEMMENVILPFRRWMSEFDMAILYIMHTGWAERTRPRGTMAIFDAASTVIAEKETEHKSIRKLLWTKQRSVSASGFEGEIEIGFNPETYQIFRTTKPEVQEILDSLSYPILRKLVVQKIEAELHISNSQAYKRVSKLVKDGLLKAEGKDMVNRTTRERIAGIVKSYQEREE